MLSLSACGQAPWEDTLRDYEGAEVRDPGAIVIWNNVDLHPNIARQCLDGVAFGTSTREYGDSVFRVPEWDKFCEGVKDKVMTK